MILIENTTTKGFEEAIRGMRNPHNSWDKSDSIFVGEDAMFLGPNDLKLMKQLAIGGSVEAKYRRMIIVYADITAPLYWWKEFDTYKIGTVSNSCSTMHSITNKEFTFDDFSCEDLIFDAIGDRDFIAMYPKEVFGNTIGHLNMYRNLYLNTDDPVKKKIIWRQIIQLLPSSYNQKRTIMMNYEVLSGIFPMRRNHKLSEWREFCNWITGLPHFVEIIAPVER